MLASEPVSDAYTSLLAKTIARHFDGARVDGATVEVGFGDLSIACEVDSVRSLGELQSATLFLRLQGGRLGEAPVFASISGYQATAEAAVIEGACLWACSFGPVLRAALADTREAEVTELDAVLDGTPVRVFVDKLDRVMMVSGGAPTAAHDDDARDRFGASPWLCQRVIESGTLPALPADRATVLSVFVADGPGLRTVEVKVNGEDWRTTMFDRAAPAPEGAIVLLRELAVVVPARLTGRTS